MATGLAKVVSRLECVLSAAQDYINDLELDTGRDYYTNLISQRKYTKIDLPVMKIMDTVAVLSMGGESFRSDDIENSRRIEQILETDIYYLCICRASEKQFRLFCKRFDETVTVDFIKIDGQDYNGTFVTAKLPEFFIGRGSIQLQLNTETFESKPSENDVDAVFVCDLLSDYPITKYVIDITRSAQYFFLNFRCRMTSDDMDVPKQNYSLMFEKKKK